MIYTEVEIQSKVKETLSNTPYAVTALHKLTGGTVNFIYRALLDTPPADCPHGVVIKQGEAYVNSKPDFPLTTSRCVVEQQCLIHLAALPPVATPSCSVSTPRAFYFNLETNTQVQEYLPNAVSLKDYTLKYSSVESQYDQIGHAVGAWLRAFHSWTQEPGQAALRETCAGNKEMQSLKNMVNYLQLLQMVDKYEPILGDARDVMQGISDLAAGEMADETMTSVIHGDFWTGNVLLPNKSIDEDIQTPIKIVDWELAQVGVKPLDLGQMIAEMWQLKLYKDIDAGETLIKSFVDGYGAVDETFAYRTIIHVGVHLICFGSQTPGWGSADQNEDLVKVAKEILVRAWERDGEWFRGHVLGCLFS